MERLLDSRDRVVAMAVEMTGRSADLAWRRIARLGITQRRCPDCGQAGPDGQMALHGAILACKTREGVVWGGGPILGPPTLDPLHQLYQWG